MKRAEMVFGKRKVWAFFLLCKGPCEWFLGKNFFVLREKKLGFCEGAVPSVVLSGQILNPPDLPCLFEVENKLVRVLLEIRAELSMPNRLGFPVDYVASPFVIAYVLTADRQQSDLIVRQEVGVVKAMECVLTGFG